MAKLYIGTVKVCMKNRFFDYLKDGDISIVSLFQIGSMREGVEINNISDAFENQILIGLENDNYYWIKEKQILGIKPTEENNIFVDKESLNLNLEDSTNTKKLIKTFKRRQLF